MGYIAHHAIIVTAWGNERIVDAHHKAVEIFGGRVSDVVNSEINGYVSFFIAPDGSKEGWADSEKGDRARENFKKWVEDTYEKYWLDVAEIRYGGDEPYL